MKTLMITGTNSSAGKSFLVTALCRYFAKKNIKVFPFKSQNMSRNFYLTEDGKKMSTAQATQAFACNLKPDVRMNPILLVPKTNTGSDVYLLGEYVDHKDARELFKWKEDKATFIKDVFDSIKKEYDLVIIEGAGSPAEINLRENDIVNMGLADLVDANVILVGDIEKGGVFASLYGTVKILEKSDSDRIKGLIINKFRGDASLLDSGIEQLEKMTDKKFLGVIPYSDVFLEDEDSLTEYKKKIIKIGDEDFIKELDKACDLINEHLDMEAIESLL